MESRIRKTPIQRIEERIDNNGKEVFVLLNESRDRFSVRPGRIDDRFENDQGRRGDCDRIEPELNGLKKGKQYGKR